MKIIAGRDTLATALKQVSRFADPKSPIPIYACVKMLALDDTLTLTTNNNTFAVAMSVPLEVADPGEVCVPAARISDLVASLRADPPVVLEHRQSLRSERLVVSSGATKAYLGTNDPTHFPVMQDKFGPPQLVVKAGELDRVLGLAIPAMGEEDIARMMLWGMALRWEREGALGIACDGFLGAVTRIHHEELDEFPQTILPRPVCSRLRNLIKGTTGSISISITSALVRISGNDWTVTTRVVNEQYPDYHYWIAPCVSTPISASAEALNEILVRIQASTDFDNQKLKQRGAVATVENNVMSLRDGQSVITDEMSVEYPADGAPVHIGFNTQQLRDALDALDVPEVELHYRDRDSSVRLCARGETDDSFTLTPYRI